MLYWLQTQNLSSYFQVFQSISFRASLAAVTAFAMSLWLGPWVIRWLKRRGMGERIVSDSAFVQQRNEAKGGTPSMGGLFIIAAMLGAILLCCDLRNYYVLLAVITLLWLGVLGYVDDYIKIRTTKSGLNKTQKLLFQIGLGLMLGWLLYEYQGATEYGTRLIFPFVRSGYLELGWLYVPLVCLVVTMTSNAVNLTDGVDGLAGGCLIMAGLAFAALAYVAGHSELAKFLAAPRMPGSGELSIVCTAMVGSVMGFLWYNCSPARVFMGDTGSLPLGGLLGYVAVVIRQEFAMLIVGGVFVAEFLSVVAQVASFKLRGKRVLKCAPLHHHYQQCGWSDTQIVTRFCIMAGVLAVFAIATLKMR